MTELTVFYDAHCPFCVRCRDWLAAEPAHVPLRLVPAESAEAAARCGPLTGLGAHLVVADERGRFWMGAAAFVVCLWALKSFRGWAFALTHPWLRGVAAFAFDCLSASRGWLSLLVAGKRCEGACGRPPRAAYR